MKHIRSISGINYQNAVNDILYHYYKSENIIFESINSQGGDFKNDGWVPDKGILVIFFGNSSYSNSVATKQNNTTYYIP